jgi:predicted secreted hydrolase
LEPARPESIHGLNNISQKGRGNATQYYSLTRLRTSGQLSLDGETFEVSGLSWMDHEFGTSILEAGQSGWDWLSVQLEDGRDLMLFQIRRSDGSIDSYSSGSIVDPDGRVTHISGNELVMTPMSLWHSDASGANYPVVWNVSIPTHDLSFKVSAAFDEQELRTTESMGVTYWEGSVAIEGLSRDKPIRGRGYLEMTGYAGASMGALMR